MSELTTEKLDEAAGVLLTQLPQADELIRALAEEYSVELWKVFAGIILACHLEGRLSAFEMDPSWSDGIKQREAICRYCGEPFEPINIGQLYCSNACGLAAFNEQSSSEQPPSPEADLNLDAVEPTLELGNDLTKEFEAEEQASKALKLLRKKHFEGSNPNETNPDNNHPGPAVPVNDPDDTGWDSVDLEPAKSEDLQPSA